MLLAFFALDLPETASRDVDLIFELSSYKIHQN